MLKGLSRLLIWFGKFVADGKTGLPSVKRVGFAMSVTILSFVMGLIGGVIAVVTWDARSTAQAVELVRIISGTLEVLAGLVLTAVTTGYIAGKSIERKPPQPGDPEQ